MKALDIEVYKDYFLAQFKDFDTGNVTAFETHPSKRFEGKLAMAFLKSDTVVTFNGNHFDLPLFGQACAGKSCEEIKAIADEIIVDGRKIWEIGIAAPSCDHIDLIEVAPGQMSLKMYGGRIHAQKMQDLPIAPDASINQKQRAQLREYCENDLDTTIALYRTLEQQIALRRAMSAEYGIDLRSKSDAQIAEAVIASEVAKATGERPGKVRIQASTKFKYKVPGFIHFQTQVLRDTLEFVRDCVFSLDAGGSPVCEALEKHKVVIGDMKYSMGKGGLHSNEKSAAHVAGADSLLLDRDVASYYPSIILNCDLYPKHIGKEFLPVYRSIVDRRLAAKKAGNKVVADTLKIVINGSFGKFGSKYSVLYSPDLLIQTTVTGQLALLMLIESLELAGVPVISANTDGIVIKCPTYKANEVEAIVWQWEFFTGFETEETRYQALYSRDVNNYLAVKNANSTKTKGVLASTSLMKSPSCEVCIDAVINKLTFGAPVDQTINLCSDPRKFITIKRVTGGAVWRGQELGKAVRWYYSTDGESIHYKSNGNKVGKSDGAKPLMELPATLPEDLDVDWYINEANEILKSLGVPK